MTYTNPHTAEVAHDTRLLELLREEYAAAVGAAGMADRLYSAVAVAYTDRRDNTVTFWNRQALPLDPADVPDGTVVSRYESRGGYTYHVVRGGEMKVATLDDCRTATMLDGNGYYGRHTVESRDKAVADLDAAVAAARAAREALAEHEAGYTGWARYWLVVSSAGHVHTTRECSTCNKGKSATRFALIPSLSGGTVDEVVALVGPNLCSTCYPLAPVADTGGKLTEAIAKVLIEEGEEAFRAKLAEHAAKAKAKCPADPYDHDGSNSHLYRPWAKCNVCGAGVSLTSTGKMRAHRPKGA